KLALLHSSDNTQAIARLQAINPRTQIYFWKFSFTMSRAEMKRYFDEVIVQMDYIDILINGPTLCKEQDGHHVKKPQICARNIVRAIEMVQHGQIWLADNERLDIVANRNSIGKLSTELQQYMQH
ncbi:hypothetical protein DOY81_012519, partial [Sarcophaga bullata]